MMKNLQMYKQHQSSHCPFHTEPMTLLPMSKEKKNNLNAMYISKYNKINWKVFFVVNLHNYPILKGIS